MKKLIMILAAGVAFLVGFGAEPTARVTDGVIEVDPIGSNVVSGVYLNTGTSVGKGASELKLITWSVSGPVTNGVLKFYTYDGGVSNLIFSTNNLVTGLSGIYKTNDVWTGRMQIYVNQGKTNAVTKYTWSIISK